MEPIDVSARVWERLLAVRQGLSCTCCGQWSPSEAAALALYGPLARRDLGPVAVAQIGQSLDGRIATVTGDARDVSGPDGLTHLHRMRALVDGIVIGVKTALHDTPRMTVRLCPGRNPARIVIDPTGRLPDDAPLLQDDGTGTRRIIIQSVDRPRADDVEVIHLGTRDGVLDPQSILEALQEKGLSSVMIEGGGITISRFLEAGYLTRLQVAIAPLLIGAGQQSLTMSNPTQTLADALRPETRVYSLGSDVVFDCALTDAAEAASYAVHAAE
ncbi:riboflavin-specific deaminase C-terminal domain-containing protein [Roseivivax halotolerans]|jgi:riboflavin-specific deaminase-like protein|uniref:Riboflavin-specific deaminase C-terminal domain-containing protein n=1 Tax=Roseivivax halotolerans TaxID=93684 RepID=A0A1I6AMG1_9RHOB|nr:MULTISPECIES: RibD family protein [Roseivivax]QFT62678.1 2,5-diamino-6-ribosylamino-4(3H)-pyrimidinone 5'-phosphate reductase [Roseivivax sp. THAF30]SFQ69918.1 riboflavin-specific deaminase C-terminal domain-containing protein [Roseivivax halotolerans]